MKNEIRTIEEVALILLKKGIPFNYEPSYLIVKKWNYNIIETATYHAETKELILMDAEYNRVSIDKFVADTRLYKSNITL